MLAHGFDPGAADYDSRSALMLAAAKGYRDTLALLLEAGADPSAADTFGGTPLWEACKGGHDDCIDLLRAKGARWGGAGGLPASLPPPFALSLTAFFQGLRGVCTYMPACHACHASCRARRAPAESNPRPRARRAAPRRRLGKQGVSEASLLCTAVFEGDLKLLRRLLRGGAHVDADDYDRRTALHVAAAEGNLAAVSRPPTRARVHPGPNSAFETPGNRESGIDPDASLDKTRIAALRSAPHRRWSCWCPRAALTWRCATGGAPPRRTRRAAWGRRWWRRSWSRQPQGRREGRRRRRRREEPAESPLRAR